MSRNITEPIEVEPEAVLYMNHYESGESDETYGDSRESFQKRRSEISEASPEPEPVYQGAQDSSTETKEYYYERKAGLLKKRQNVFVAGIVALAVMLLGVLVGLIVVATAHRPPSKEVPVETVQIPKELPHSELKLSYDFPHFGGNDAAIATAFADHSLYTSFYGVTYDGPGEVSLDGTDPESIVQHQIALDVALLSRVTPRIRVASYDDHLADHVIGAITDIHTAVDLVLSVDVANGSNDLDEVLRILNSYPDSHVSAVHIEKSGNSSELEVYTVYDTLQKFVNRKHLPVSLKVVTAQREQGNPLEISKDHPKLAAQYLNNDHVNNVYLNLETPDETSEKAVYMTSWVCGVAPTLRSDIEWFWPNAFDDSSRNISNAIFTDDRKIKPAGLPRCQSYNA